MLKEGIDGCDYYMEVTLMAGHGITPEKPVSTIFNVRGNTAKKAVAVLTDDMAAVSPLRPGDSKSDSPVFLSRVLRVFGFAGSPEDIRKMTVLDLGCGNEVYRDGMYPPRFCRDLHAYGVKVTGVDCDPPNREGRDEGWDFRQMNLMEKGALDVFPDKSFDIVWSSGLIGHTDIYLTSPNLPGYGEEHGLITPAYRRIEDEIFDQALRILKPGGLFILNNGTTVYQKILDEDFASSFERKEKKIKSALEKREEPPLDIKYRLIDSSILIFD